MTSRRSITREFSRSLALTGQFIRITGREFVADKLMLRSMALTYATVLSLVPLLAILFSLFKMLGGGNWFDSVVRPALLGILAPGAQPVVIERLASLISHFAAKTVGGIGFVLLLVTVHAIFSAVESTFNLIWAGAPRGRPLLRAPLYWGLLLVIPLMIGGSLVLTTYLTTLKFTAPKGFLVLLEHRAIPWAMVATSLFTLYKFLPTITVRWPSAALGAMVAGVIYEVVKHFFLFYASKLVKYDVLYGSLAIVPMLLIWLNMAWIVTLFGVEISYVYQHFEQLRRDPKHIHLTREQNAALAFCVLSEVIDADATERKWVQTGKLAERWLVPSAVMNDTVYRLVEAGILERRGQQVDLVRLAKAPTEITVSEVDAVLGKEDAETWIWPDEADWTRVRSWQRTRERRGSAGSISMDRLRRELLSEQTPGSA